MKLLPNIGVLDRMYSECLVMSYIELYMTTAGTKTFEEGLTSLYGTSGEELMSRASTIIKFDEV